jgi:hypothetical protein
MIDGHWFVGKWAHRPAIILCLIAPSEGQEIVTHEDCQEKQIVGLMLGGANQLGPNCDEPLVGDRGVSH